MGPLAGWYRPAVRILTICVLILSGTMTLAQDFGPIATRNHRAVSLPFLRFEPNPNLLKQGKKRWDSSWTVANDFRLAGEGTVVEDYEVHRLVLSYREGMTGGMEWSVEVPWVSRNGGFLDPIIDWWHETVLGWSDPRRNGAAFGRRIIQFPKNTFSGSADGVGDVSLYLSKTFGKGVVGSIGLKVPTGNAGQLLGSGGVDAGVYVQAQFAVARKIQLHAQLGLVAQGRATRLENARPFIHQQGLALVWQANSRDAWIAQWQAEVSAVRSFVGGSDNPHRLITLGYKRKLSESHSLDLFFSEDRDLFSGRFPKGANIGPDFTIGVRLGVEF